MTHARPRSILASDPPLADTLRLMMPCASTTLLLQAALLPGDLASKAWSQWRQDLPDPKAFLASDRAGIKRHLPLLYRNLTTCGADVGRDLEPYFRAARAREELRSARYRRFLGDALNALQRSGIELVVGKGVTVGETIHADPVVRHSHDIDLLVRSADMPAAAAALNGAGFPASRLHGPRNEHRFDHKSGLPVELHDRLYRTPFYDGDFAGLWGRAREDEILGVPVRVISDADLLVHAPVHASVVPQRYGLSWIVDVVSLLQKRDSQGIAIDWMSVTRIAGEAHAALPLYVTYQYLATMCNASIPQYVIEELRRMALKTGPLQHLAAWDGLRCESRHQRIKVILAASGWRSRAAIARAMLFPPPAYFQAIRPGIRTLPLALLYVTRPLRFGGRQLNRVRYRLRQRWRPLASSPGTPGEDRRGGSVQTGLRLPNSAPTPTLPRSTRGGRKSDTVPGPGATSVSSVRRVNTSPTAEGSLT